MLAFLCFIGNATAKYLSPEENTSEIKKTISDVFLKKKIINTKNLLLIIDGLDK